MRSLTVTMQELSSHCKQRDNFYYRSKWTSVRFHIRMWCVSTSSSPVCSSLNRRPLPILSSQILQLALNFHMSDLTKLVIFQTLLIACQCAEKYCMCGSYIQFFSDVQEDNSSRYIIPLSCSLELDGNGLIFEFIMSAFHLASKFQLCRYILRFWEKTGLNSLKHNRDPNIRYWDSKHFFASNDWPNEPRWAFKVVIGDIDLSNRYNISNLKPIFLWNFSALLFWYLNCTKSTKWAIS